MYKVLLLIVVAIAQKTLPEQTFYQVQLARLSNKDVDSDQVCSRIQSLPVLSHADVYFLEATRSLIDDCHIDQSFDGPLDEFESFYYKTQSELLLGTSTRCSEISDFFGTNGAVKLNRKKSDDHYRYSGLLHILAHKCGVLFDLELQTALINIQEVYESNNAILDRENSISATAQLICAYLITNIPQPNKQAQKYFHDVLFQNTIVNLFSTRQGAKDTYWTRLVFDLVKDAVIPVIQVQQSTVTVKFQTLQGNKAQANNVTISINGQEVKTRSKDNTLILEKLPKGTHNLVFQFTDHIHQQQVIIQEQIKVLELFFSVVNSKAKPSFDHSADEPEVYPVTLNANEHSFLHVTFKLEKQCQHVAVRLVHKDKIASTQVFAEYDRKRGTYYAIIDFGDPDHVTPTNGEFSVELLLADQYVQAKRWTFLNLDCKFSSQSPIKSDHYYPIQDQIIHQFQAPMPEIPFLVIILVIQFVSVFAIAIIGAFIFYLSMLKDFNYDKIPKDSYQYVVYLFVVILIAVFLVLVLFWVQLNLLETLTILSVMSIPMFLVGNFALLSLRNKSKTD